MVYTYVYSKDGTLTGYTNFILSHFDPEDFPAINGTVIREFRSEDPETCRYFDYREPHDSGNPYKRKDVYWHVLAARLAFVVIFQVCYWFFYLPFKAKVICYLDQKRISEGFSNRHSREF